MQAIPDEISDVELNAYVDGQLDDWRRLEVEEHLARHPQQAARVMQDIHLCHELRLALTRTTGESDAQRSAGLRLSRAMRRDARLRRMLRLTPAAALLAMGWLAEQGLGPFSVRPGIASSTLPPPVTAALSARDASTIRLAMLSQPETGHIDPEEMRAATGIQLPDYPDDWQLRDAQVFPSPQGPGVEILFDTPDMGRLSHFAVPGGSFDMTPPQSEARGAQSVAWFQTGRTAHVLIADNGGTTRLLDAAEDLAEELY